MIQKAIPILNLQQQLPAWASLPILNQERENAIDLCLHKRDTSSSESLISEAEQVVLATKTAISFLKKRCNDCWEWRATILYRDWLESERACLLNEVLPPLCYSIELKIRELKTGLEERILLSPIVCRLITQLDPDLGRRVGDELDGLRPRSSELSDEL